VAVLGCGYWGKNLVRNFAALDALTWICDASEAALAAEVSKYPGVRPTSSYNEVLDDPGVQAIVIASPAALHYEHASAALAAGKDVFVEKPLSLTYREGERLVQSARRDQRVLMVGHVLEYHPAVEALKAIVFRGDLGEIRYIYSNRLNLGKVRHEENILWSFAPHDISIMTTILGAEPVSVASSGGVYLRDGVHDVTVTALTFPGVARGHIFVSWLHPHKEQRLTVVGSEKMAVFDDTLKEGKLRVFDKGIDFEGDLPIARSLAEEIISIDAAEPLRRECEHFLACVAERREPISGPDNALRVLKVLEASQLSLDSGGRPVRLAEIEEAVALA
jgi:UDP-2-acetamido-3-amino-2,3-dideoxy-glucuronate N-acetyltransferase